MTINFYLNKSVSKPEKPIYCFIRQYKQTIKINTKDSILPKYWSTEKQRAKKTYSDSVTLNNYLNRFEENIRKIIRKTLSKDQQADIGTIREHLLKELNKKPKSFISIYDLFLEAKKPNITRGTYNKYVQMKKQLQRFEIEKKYRLTFQSINRTFFDKYRNYLIEINHNNNTIHKEIGHLKTFLNWSLERGYTKNTDYKFFKVKKYKKEVIFLTEKELQRLFEIELPNKALSKVRDVFCFACFTGARYSDIQKIKRTDIVNNFLKIRVKKTRDILEIPLLSKALRILKKYENENKPLPVISNQKTNKYLKEVCKFADINEPITIHRYNGAKHGETTIPKYETISFHTARKTFITLSLEKGMSAETIMKITGHKDYKTFKGYFTITNEIKKVELFKAWEQPELKLAEIPS